MFTDSELMAAYPKIYAFAVTLTKDTSRARDVTHETVLRMLQHRGDYRREDKLASWGFKIAQNYHYDECALLRSKHEIMVGMHAPDVPACDDPQPRIDLRDCVDFLGRCNGSGEALLMLALGDSHEQIALAQDVAVNTVKTRIMRTREKVEQHYGIERESRRSSGRRDKRTWSK